MKTTVEPLEGNKVKVSVEVDEQEFDKAIDAAFRKLAREVRIPGFRPGKAPRKVLEKRLGPEVGRHQALHDSVPEYYAEAVKEHEVDVIAAPELEIKEGEEEGPVSFEAIVEIRPVVTVGGYGSLRVTIDKPEATDEEISEQLERLRKQFGELETVERAAIEGDFVTIDINGTHDGEPVDQLTADDYLYEIGSGGILPEVDANLTGTKAGDIIEFTAAFPGAGPAADDDDDDDDDERPSDLAFKVLVKDVKEKILPELDDEFANEASEFETLAELDDDLRRRLTGIKKAQAQMQLRENTGAALADLVEEDVPEALINSEVQQRLQDLAMRLQAQGLDLDSWMAMSGKGPDEVVGELRETAAQAVKVDLALRAVAEAETIECDDDDLEEEFAKLAERMNLKTADVRKQFERAEQVPAVRSDIRKRKAFDWLLEHVEIVDGEGNPIDADTLVLETEGVDDVDEVDQAASDSDDNAAEDNDDRNENSENSEDDE